VFPYDVAGVALFVVGCVLSIFATARRTARGPRAPAAARAPQAPTSASVARLLRDVGDWTKRR
jgi:hypothetical protein